MPNAILSQGYMAPPRCGCPHQGQGFAGDTQALDKHLLQYLHDSQPQWMEATHQIPLYGHNMSGT